jgi:hypothetical protein
MIRSLISGATVVAITLGMGISTAAVGQTRSDDEQVKAERWRDQVPTKFDWQHCSELSNLLVVSLPQQTRPAGIALLQNKKIVQLSEAETSSLIGVERSSASKMFTGLLQRLEAEKASGKGSWSAHDESRLIDLKTRTAQFKPYLARWVARNEAAEMIGLRLCGDELVINAVALGLPPTQLTRVPLVIFLESRPKNLLVLNAPGRALW